MNQEKSTFFVSRGYPPESHLLRDLRPLLTFQDCGQATIQAPIVPQICSDNGSIHVGVLATLADVLGGFLSMEIFLPGWMATANLSIHSTGRASYGAASAAGRVIRSGRNTATVSAELFQGPETVVQPEYSIGSAMITYSKIEGVKADFGAAFKRGRHVDFKLPDGNSGFKRHLIEQTGLQLADKRPGVVALNMTEYVRNSFGSLQGGMIAMLADIAGQSAARDATGRRLITVDLILHYLSPGRVGPFETVTRVLRSNGASALSRVEVKDAGDDQRIIAVAMNTAVLAGGTPKENG
jgi:uncharacterized protein (TIGR00369 family)